tara:strand:+ start:735 stop:926 length:192 start_codon:yes stop_codon:yes gene_type:complete
MHLGEFYELSFVEFIYQLTSVHVISFLLLYSVFLLSLALGFGFAFISLDVVLSQFFIGSVSNQ